MKPTHRAAAKPPRRPLREILHAKSKRVGVRPLRKITVLVVDDSTLVRKGLRTLLKIGDYCEVVGQARNGREGVKLARTLKPDVILMDIAMPVM